MPMTQRHEKTYYPHESKYKIPSNREKSYSDYTCFTNCTKLCRQLKCHQHISESDISLKVILRVCKCHITSFVKAPVLFFSLGVLCDAPLLPEGTSRCTHLAAHSSKRFNHLFATGYEMHQLMCHWSFQ